MNSHEDIFIPHIGWVSFPERDEVARFVSEGWFEHAEQAFWWLYLRDGDVVIDGGAHAGLYTRLAALATGSTGKVVAVEPIGQLTDFIQRNTSEFGEVVVEQSALGAVQGTVRLSIEEPGRLAYTSTLSKADASGFESPVVTIDGLISKRALDRVALLKLDIEGSEPEAIKGAAGVLARGAVDVVMMEFDEKIMQRCGTTTEQLAKILTDTGLELYRFNPGQGSIEPLALDGPLWYDNVLAIRDPQEVQGRLKNADPVRIRIAQDLARRSTRSEALVKKAWEFDKSKISFDEQKKYNERLELLLSEANADREELRCAIGEVEGRASEANQDRKDLRHAINHANQEVERFKASDKLNSDAIVKAVRLLNPEAPSGTISPEDLLEACEFCIDNAQQTLRDMERDAERVLREKDRLVERLEVASEELSYAAGLASLYGGAIERAMRVPFAGVVVPSLSVKVSPWIENLREELGRVRRIVPQSIVRDQCSGALDDEDQSGADSLALSVILCTHNPRMDLLQWTLQSIRDQSLNRSRFEIVVVDNNSEPALEVESIDPDGSLGVKVIKEPRAGLSNARIAGLNATTAPLLVYVDDDNALSPDYLEQAVAIAGANEEIGSFGGIADAVLEVDPPQWIVDLLPHLGVRDYGLDVITSKEQCWGQWDPIGAGMVVRRVVAERFAQIVESKNLGDVLGRRGKVLSSGEDTLMNRCANFEGLACSYQPALRLRHYMKSERLNRRHISKTIQGHGQAFVSLEHVVGRQVEPIKGRKKIAWLIGRGTHRILGSLGHVKQFGVVDSLKHGWTLWHWDLGFQKASTDQSGQVLGDCSCKATNKEGVL